MPDLITRLASSVVASQSRRVRAEIMSERVTRSISGPSAAEELRDAFVNRMTELSASKSAMLTQDWSINDGDQCDSEEMQFIFERAVADLTALFAETNLLDEVVSRQSDLMKDAVRGLASKMRLLESSARAVAIGLTLPDGASILLLEDGRAVSSRLDRSSSAAAELHVDPKIGAVMDWSLDMLSSEEQDGLTISHDILATYTPSLVLDVVGADSVEGGRFGAGIAPSTTPARGGAEGEVSNVIDGRRETFYRRHYEVAPGVASVMLSLFFSFSGSVVAVNNILVDPTGPKPVKVHAVYYVDINDGLHSVDLGGPREIDDRSSITFDRIDAKAIYLILKSSASSPAPGADSENKVFSIGVDDAAFRLVKTRDRGIYVSQLKEVAGSALYFDAELAPVDALTPPQFMPTIEHWLYYEERNASGGVINTLKTQILPARESSIRERIFFRGSDSTALAFVPLGETIDLYRDGVLMLEGAGGYSLAVGSHAVEGRAIVTIAAALDRASEYVAIYNVAHRDATSQALVRDITGTLSYRQDGTIGIVRSGAAERVQVSLITIARKSLHSDKSPVIRNLTLVSQK